MQITINTIAHSDQAYDTVGNWQIADGNITIQVSDMGNNDYEFLVGIHEAVEAYLCQKNGISEADVTAFDENYEANRPEGDESEPGDSEQAPYRTQHIQATQIEKLVANQMGIDWDTYNKAVVSLGGEKE
jgi:hypothetical protein